VERIRSQKDPETLAERLRSMGLQLKPAPGGECVAVALPFAATPIETLRGPRKVGQVVFSTIGSDRIKCLRPRAFFQLPILRIHDCRTPQAIELRIRNAWDSHLRELRRTQQWLSGIGVDVESAEEDSILRFALSGESPDARPALFDLTRIVLPTQGPLAGLSLAKAEDRCMDVDRSLGSSVDFEIAISNRLEQLAAGAKQHESKERYRALEAESESKPKKARQRAPRVLVVGPKLSEERTCLEALRLRGYALTTVRSARQALAALDQGSPELVLADVDLGRSEGTELIVDLESQPGIERVPVILVDAHRRDSVREAARQVGAAGYLVHPVDVKRISPRLAKLVGEPTTRRFTRYRQRLSVHLEGCEGRLDAGLVTWLGRGGMFVQTGGELPGSLACRLKLPGGGPGLDVEVEVVHRASPPTDDRRGFGVRFQAFSQSGEARLIDYLRAIDVAGSSAR